MFFEYPQAPHVRRHGPRGYRDPHSYKPWLRDEFAFRCVYCLWREVWCSDGDGSFGVDHLLSRVRHPALVNDYENLVYSCSRCNSLKQDNDSPSDPCREAWNLHLEVQQDGTIQPRTPVGAELIELCRLDRPSLNTSRRKMIHILTILRSLQDSEARELYLEYCGYPQNLPALEILRPPHGNTRLEGIQESFLAKRRLGTLPPLA